MSCHPPHRWASSKPAPPNDVTAPVVGGDCVKITGISAVTQGIQRSTWSFAEALRSITQANREVDVRYSPSSARDATALFVY